MNDLQNAYALSRSEYSSSCQRKEIEKLRRQGKYILGCTGDIHCRFTDAIIASEDRIESVHNTYAEAIEANGGEPDDGYMWIAEPLPLNVPYFKPVHVDDCPF